MLNHVLRHENVDDALNIDEWPCLVVDELAGKLSTLLGVHPHDVLEELSVVGSEVDFLRVENDLIELPSLGEACDDLVGYVGAEVDGEGERHVMQTNDVSKLFSAFELVPGTLESKRKIDEEGNTTFAYLVLLEPLLEKLLSPLSEDRTSEFERLVLVELSFLKQDAEVLEDG